MQEMLRFT